MNNGLVDLKELRKQIGKTKYEGKNSVGFKIGDKFVKVYIRDQDRVHHFFATLDPDKVVDFSNYSADTIVFPDEYIYENNHKAGEISKFINSKRLDEVNMDYANIKSMIDGYEKVLQDLYLYHDINMFDLCFVNVLYSNKKGFHIIDTTEWTIKKESLYKNIYRFNESIMDVLLDYLQIPYILNHNKYCINKDFLVNFNEYGKKGIELTKAFELIDKDKYNFLKFMFAYMDVYRIHYAEEAKTLKDVKELTKVIKKG